MNQAQAMRLVKAQARAYILEVNKSKKKWFDLDRMLHYS